MTEEHQERKSIAWQRTEDGAGYTFPDFDWLAEQDPGYNDVRYPLASRSFEPTGEYEFPVKYREILVGVLLCYRGYHTAEPHFRRAIREGATMKEIIEALQCAVMPTGFPTLHFALQFLINIDNDMKAGRPV